MGNFFKWLFGFPFRVAGFLVRNSLRLLGIIGIGKLAVDFIEEKEGIIGEEDLIDTYLKRGKSAFLTKMLLYFDADGVFLMFEDEESGKFALEEKVGRISQIRKLDKFEEDKVIEINGKSYYIHPVKKDTVVVGILGILKDSYEKFKVDKFIDLAVLSLYYEKLLKEKKGINELLNLYTEEHLEKVLRKEFERVERENLKLALLLIEIKDDLEKSKLKEIVTSIRNNFRIYDPIIQTKKGFGVILYNIDIQQAKEITIRGINNLKENYKIDVVAGLAIYPEDATTAEHLFHYAQEALEKAKEEKVTLKLYSELYSTPVNNDVENNENSNKGE